MKKPRVRFKQQMADTDCGPACLAMIASAYGHQLSVYAARLLCEEHGPALSLRNVVAAARGLGFKASMVAADMPALESVALPCIIHWDFSHFVVLEKITRSGFVVSDPALGKRRISQTEFDLHYTGIAATLEPGEEFTRKKHSANQSFRNYARRALITRPIVRTAAAMLLLAALLQTASLLSPLLTVYVVDVVMPMRSSALHTTLLWMIVSAGLGIAATTYLRTWTMVKIQRLVDASLLEGFMTHVLRLPARFFLDKSVSDIQSRMNSGTYIRDALSTYMVSTFLDSMLAVSYVCVLAYLSLGYGLLTSAFAIVQLGIYAWSGASMREKLVSELKTQSLYQAYVLEVLTGMLTIKASSAEHQVMSVWKRKFRNYLISAQERSIVDGRISSAATAVRVLAPATLLWYSVLGYFDGSISMGTVMALGTVSGMALAPLSSLATTVRYFQTVRSHGDRMSDIWWHEVEKEGGQDAQPLAKGGTIEFRNVSFRYASALKPSVRDVSFQIALGSKVGIVGPSGSGKSTLVSLLLRFHLPTNGSIFINEVDVSDLRLASLREQFGYVSQATFLFNDTIRRNLALGLDDISVDEASKALDIAGLTSTIEGLPMGLDSVIGADGSSLSGGQRQRLAIARALARRPRLLILDEATSSLDSATERAVAEAVSAMDCTQIIITHRLSTIRSCDQIIVMEDGQISAVGTHDDLCITNAFYADCVRLQGMESREVESIV
jgi:ABC-type bacteriocin/lantibiotic exporter with double-glycine peptidase domain